MKPYSFTEMGRKRKYHVSYGDTVISDSGHDTAIFFVSERGCKLRDGGRIVSGYAVKFFSSVTNSWYYPVRGTLLFTCESKTCKNTRIVLTEKCHYVFIGNRKS
jgi:hypothetical protein